MFIDLNRCIGCAACVMACKQQNGTASGVFWCNVYTREVGEYPTSKMSVIPMSCMHCDDAPCVNVCPTGASYKREDGIVLVDYDLCIGCRVCINACPYNARHYNYVDPKKKPYWEGFELTPFEKVKTVTHGYGKTEKCVFCYELLEQGKEPACVTTCVSNARIVGDLSDPNSELRKAIAEKNAKPLRADLGTKPSIYYAGEF